MSAVVELPSCVALQSKRNGSYLRYVHEDGETYKQLQLNGEDAINPFTRFDVETSLLHEGLVHIRCRYNRKYWVASKRGDTWWIVADADEPEEDLTKSSCTLIKAVPVTADDSSRAGVTADDDPDESATTFRFLLAGMQASGKDDNARMVLSDSANNIGRSCMRVGRGLDQQGGNDDDGFIVLNLSSSKRTLPRDVVFKGYNGKYLSGREIQKRNHLSFTSDDIGDATVVHEIFYRSDGISFRVRNKNFNRSWRRGTDMYWILVDADNSSASVNNNQTWFEALLVTDDFFALRNANNRRFCISQTLQSSHMHCLDAIATTITREARVVVEEAVLHREIYNIDYRLIDARIYDTNVLTMATTTAVNDTSRENTKRLRLFYEETEMSTWDSTLELKLGYKATIRAGFPKLGLGATVNVSAEFFGAYNWGKTVEKTVKHEVEYEVAVPPNTKVTVKLLATKGTCDVPFNYRQRDIMVDGRTRETLHRDGLYTGINSYNFKFETVEEKLPARKISRPLEIDDH